MNERACGCGKSNSSWLVVVAVVGFGLDDIGGEYSRDIFVVRFIIIVVGDGNHIAVVACWNQV